MKGTLSQKTAIKLLKAHGWKQEHGGKHQVKMTKQAVGRSRCRITRDATIRQAWLPRF